MINISYKLARTDHSLKNKVNFSEKINYPKIIQGQSLTIFVILNIAVG